jgi:hypothetical protein
VRSDGGEGGHGRVSLALVRANFSA